MVIYFYFKRKTRHSVLPLKLDDSRIVITSFVLELNGVSSL
jgi:hypothetical protein